MSTHKLDQARSHGFEIFEKTSFSVTSTETTEGFCLKRHWNWSTKSMYSFSFRPMRINILANSGCSSINWSSIAWCFTSSPVLDSNICQQAASTWGGRARKVWSKPFCWERFGMQYDAMSIQKNKCTEDMVGHTWVWHGMTMYDLASTSRSIHKLTTRTSTCSRRNVYNQMQNKLGYAASSKICRVHMSLIRSNHLLVPVACSQVSSLPYQAWPV